MFSLISSLREEEDWKWIISHFHWQMNTLGYNSTPQICVLSILFIIMFPCTKGVPGRPEITGFTKPAKEGDIITLTCTTSGSKPAANIRWFRNDKEVQGKQFVVDFTKQCIFSYHLFPLGGIITVKSFSCCIPLCSYSCILPPTGV